MTMWVSKLVPLHYLMLKSGLWKQPEMVQDNISGLDNKTLTESGTDSIPKFSLTREHHTLTRYTSGHNTITIRTTSVRPPSKETTSNTTTTNGSPVKTESGTSEMKDSM